MKALRLGWYFYPRLAAKETEAQKVKREQGLGPWVF